MDYDKEHAIMLPSSYCLVVRTCDIVLEVIHGDDSDRLSIRQNHAQERHRVRDVHRHVRPTYNVTGTCIESVKPDNGYKISTEIHDTR